MSGPPDLVLAGNLLVDDIVLADGTTLLGEPGGAVLHAALAASLWGCRVGILSVVGSDYPTAALDALASRGVDLTGVRPLGGPGGRAWLLHEPSARRVIHHLDSPSHAAISPTPADLPTAWHAARGIHLAPMPLERQLELACSLAAGDTEPRPFVSLDPFEIVRDETAARWREPLAHVDALFAGEDDLRLSGSTTGTLGDLAGDRLRLLVLKQADRGGMLIDRHAADTHGWNARAEEVIDVTGAGDAFAGGFLAGWLATGDIPSSLAQGVVSASLVLEGWGSRGLARATPALARARLAEWFPEVAREASREPVAR
jgi:sugar/nucleoside kinase (ribokinase family)